MCKHTKKQTWVNKTHGQVVEGGYDKMVWIGG